MSTLLRSRRRLSTRTSALLTLLLLLVATIPAALQAQRLTLATRAFSASDTGAAVDVGALPASQPIHLTLRLALTADRSAALDQLLSSQTIASSTSYHQWLTPQQFAASYGATGDQLVAITSWLQTQGLTVDAVSPAKTRLTVSGTAAQVESAFAVTLRSYQVAGALHFANSNQPSLPQEVASLIAGVSGLDDMPAAAPTTLFSFTGAGQSVVPAASESADPFLTAATAIDANTAPILMLSTTACSTDLAPSDYDAYHDLFRQANAQGITILATSGCGTRSTGSFPASLGEVTALTTAPTTSPFVAIALRPAWQSAPGLPANTSRYEPDLTATSVTDFAQTLNTIVLQSGSRQGNINATLYALAPTPDLYSQPDATDLTTPGTWEPATGLGVVNLQTLAKVFPRGSAASTTSLISSSSSLVHGQTFTLTATVNPGSGSVAPTGTVIFSSPQVGVLGSASLTSAGVATYTIKDLPGGVYGFSASYAGDSGYIGSTSGTATVTVLQEASQTNADVESDVVVGHEVTVNVRVASTSGVEIARPTGKVTIMDGTRVIGSAVLTDGAGTFRSMLVAGKHSYTAVYAGDANYATSASTPKDVTGNLAATITLTSNVANQSSILAGGSIVITATVLTTTQNTAVPTGTVSFFDNFGGTVVLLGNPVALSSNGAGQASAVFSSTGLVAGTHSIYAVYSGDSNFAPVTSSSLSITIGDFSLTMIPQTLTITQGHSGQVVILVGLIGGFNGTVTFGCTPPASTETSCSFTPLTLTGGGTTVMTISTTAPMIKKSTQVSRLGGRWSIATGSVMAVLFCFAVPRRRRALPTLLLLLVSVSLTANLGCVSVPSSLLQQTDPTDPTDPPPTDPGTPLGTQIFSITSAGSNGVNSVRHNYQYQVTIQ